MKTIDEKKLAKALAIDAIIDFTDDNETGLVSDLDDAYSIWYNYFIEMIELSEIIN